MINITDKLRIDDSDGIEWTVRCVRVISPKDQPKRMEWRDSGHYPSLRAAMIGAWNNHVNALGKERESLGGLLSAMAHAEMAFLAAVDQVAKR